MTDATTVAARRATAARMSHDGASLRTIAAHLGVGKDTVRRDLAAAKEDTVRQPDQHKETPATPSETGEATAHDTPGATDATPSPSTAYTRQQRVSEADLAMRQLGLAVTSAVAARPSHVIVRDAVAHRWAAELRAHIDSLTTLADAFSEYYPDGVAPPDATMTTSPTDPKEPS